MAGIGHIGIVGAGLAGLTAALAAALAGVRVDVFEAEPVIAQPPAHIDVVPNLLRDLATLGLAPACVRAGFPYQGMPVMSSQGLRHFEIPTPRLAGAQWPAALGMVYGDLLGLVQAAAQALGVRLHLGRVVSELRADGALVTADGERHPVDLAVIASGHHPARPATLAERPMPLETLPQQWCHVLLPRPIALEQATWFVGANAFKAMAVPVDTRRAGIAVMRPLGADTGAAAMRGILAAQGGLMQAMGQHWHDSVPTVVRPVRAGLLAGAWHDHGVLRLGGSAHQLPPHFGQSAAQAVEDALVLGDLLRVRPTRAVLFDEFMARRGARAAGVLAVTTQAARWDLRPEAATDLPALAARLAPLVARPS